MELLKYHSRKIWYESACWAKSDDAAWWSHACRQTWWQNVTTSYSSC